MPENNIIAQKIFTLDDQIRFAKFSGDYNPIHVDPLAARKTLSGQCIVHGMHLLLWCLESVLGKEKLFISEVQVAFQKPVFLQELISCIWVAEKNKILIFKENALLTQIKIKTNLSNFKSNIEIQNNSFPSKKQPNELTFDQCKNMIDQKFEIFGEPELGIELFPILSKKIGSIVAIELAGLSQVVGMECPGLYSLYTSLNVKFRANRSDNSSYSVINHDQRFNLFKIAVEGKSLEAEIEAFLRPPPVVSASIKTLKSQVKKDEFKNISALIIGGSRGLGEVVAKLIAAGGGDSVITYNKGESESKILQNEIRSYGGKCEVRQLTISKHSAVPCDINEFNQVYFFASPKIFGKRGQEYDLNLEKQFTDIYVHGFESICRSILQREISVTILYPSTIAIDEPIPALLEYISAKVQGEQISNDLNNNKLIKILTPRLPRLDTDQTMSMVKVASEDTVNVLLPLIREMQN